MSQHSFRTAPRFASGVAILILMVSDGLVWSGSAESAEMELDGTAVATRIADREEGDASRRVLDIVLTDRRGKTRERSALVLKSNDGDARVSRFTFLSPKSVNEVTFLSHDYLNPEESDDRWLYLPATRKVRRIPASDRGDYFLGTDFTYEDIQSEFKLALSDYDFVLDESLEGDAGPIYRISGSPKTEAIARELGYGGVRAEVNASTWLFNWVEFLDMDRESLKTVTIHSAGEFDGIWCATDIQVVNHQTAHETRFLYQEVEYSDDLPDSVFDAATLNRGLPPQFAP